MSFDYPYTCPIIDRNLKEIKEHIQNTLSELIQECSPLLPSEVLTKVSEDYMERIYSDIEYNIENVRNTNEDMRVKAENQISDIKYEMQALEEIIAEKDTEIQDLQQSIKDLEEDLENLRLILSV